MPAAATQSSAQRFLDPAVLARLKNLDLVSRRVVDGFLSGLHKAVNLGASTDFAGYRSYTPGDDIRRIDWRVYGRTDRLYIKTFEAETNADVLVALDCSGSMQFQSAAVEKFDYARMLAASLVHLSAQQRDRVGYASFDTRLRHRVSSSTRHRDRILRIMASEEAQGESDIDAAFGALTDQIKRRGIAIVISDFYNDPASAVRALENLSGRGQDVIAIHVLDPMEQSLSISESQVFEDAETSRRVPVAAGSASEYRALMDAHIENLGSALRSRQIDYLTCVTNEPLDHTLHAYLAARAQLRRTRR